MGYRRASETHGTHVLLNYEDGNPAICRTNRSEQPPNSSTYNLATTSTDHPAHQTSEKTMGAGTKQESVRICDAFYQFFE